MRRSARGVISEAGGGWEEAVKSRSCCGASWRILWANLTLKGSGRALTAQTLRWPDERSHFALLDTHTHTLTCMYRRLPSSKDRCPLWQPDEWSFQGCPHRSLLSCLAGFIRVVRTREMVKKKKYTDSYNQYFHILLLTGSQCLSCK